MSVYVVSSMRVPQSLTDILNLWFLISEKRIDIKTSMMSPICTCMVQCSSAYYKFGDLLSIFGVYSDNIDMLKGLLVQFSAFGLALYDVTPTMKKISTCQCECRKFAS